MEITPWKVANKIGFKTKGSYKGGMMECDGIGPNEMVLNEVPLFGSIKIEWSIVEVNGTSSISLQNQKWRQFPKLR